MCRFLFARQCISDRKAAGLSAFCYGLGEHMSSVCVSASSPVSPLESTSVSLCTCIFISMCLSHLHLCLHLCLHLLLHPCPYPSASALVSPSVFVCMCISVCIRLHLHLCLHLCLHRRPYLTSICIHMCTGIFLSVCICDCTLHLHLHLHLCLSASASMSASVPVCIGCTSVCI